MNRWLPLGATALVYLAAWVWAETVGFLGSANWVSHNVVPFAAISLVAAWRGRWRGVAWTLGGLIGGIILGGLIGDPIYQHQLDELARQELHPAYRQDWEPHHPGWAIAGVTFLIASGVGIFRRRSASSSSAEPQLSSG